jgi:tetratricopeptide (TPR) repeat protein
MLLRDRADWAIKKHLLDAFMQQRGYSLESPPTDQQHLTDLQAFDLRYHELSAEGLYHRVYPADTLLTRQEISEAEENPPPYTRARIRGEAIRLSRECGLHVRTERWTDVNIEDTPLNLSDPLEFDHPALAAWDRPWHKLEKEIEENPDSYALYYRLGRYYQGQGLYQRAAQALQTAVEHAPEDSNFVHELARNFNLMGKYNEAVQWFENYNQLADHNRDRDSHDYSSLAYAYRHLGDYQKALQLYRKAAQSDTSSRPLAYRGIGMVHLMRGEIDSAATYFQKSLQTTHERLLSSVGLGAVLWSRGELDQARSLFNEALILPQHRATLGLTNSTARYIQALAQIGLERETGLAALMAALQTQTAEAADGIFLAKTLLRLMAQISTAPRDASAGLALVEPVQVIMDPPDTADLPVMAERTRRWLDNALNHSLAAIRAQAVLSLAWRLDQEPPPNYDALLRQLVEKAQQDSAPEVRRAAVQALGRLKNTGMAITEDLIRCLQDRSATVRWEAQSALEQIYRPDPTPAGVVEVSSTISGSRPNNHQDRVAEFPADEISDVPDWLDAQF